ncbi:MAG: HupE/UreJ family protein, partial [Thiohalomonadales bacterium]
LNIKKLMIDRSGSNVYLNVPFTSNCNSNTGFKLKYNFLFDQDAFHKTILSIKDNNNNTTNILSYSTREITYNNQNNNSIYHFFEFIYQGIIHVLIGLDHVLFVICLLLSATVRVTIKNDKKLKPLLNNIFKLVTAFTIAHSITLIMASTKILSISPTIIEPIIALSVIVLALLNLINTKNVKHWPIVFAFGLIHGFGFAFVLDEVPIQSGELISSLFGFNLGVEIGQLTIVAILIPVLYFMYSKLYYQRLIIPALSIVIASIGIFWFLERTLII